MSAITSAFALASMDKVFVPKMAKSQVVLKKKNKLNLPQQGLKTKSGKNDSVTQESPFFCLSVEMLLAIFAFLPEEALWILSMTCRRMHELTSIVLSDRCHASNRMERKWISNIHYFATSIPLLKYILDESFDEEEIVDNVRVSELAAVSGSLHVIQWAYEQNERFGTSYMSLEKTSYNAAEYGHLHVLKWLHENCPSWYSYNRLWGAKLLECAAISGHLHILQWCTAVKLANAATILCVRIKAARHGHLHILEWIKEVAGINAIRLIGVDIPALGGHFEVVKWMVAHGCPLSKAVGEAAVQSGHLDMLKWTIANGVEASSSMFTLAVFKGDLPMVQWIHGLNIDADRNNLLKTAVALSASNGHLEVLKWLHAEGCPLTDDIVYDAASIGRMDVLRYLLENGCRPSWNLSYNAAYAGDLELLKLAHEKGSRLGGLYWTGLTCEMAALGRHLEVLKWLRENGCPWDSSTCAAAAKAGDLEVLQWARDNGCKWSAHTCDCAASHGHLEVLKWALKNGCHITWRARVHAEWNGHKEVVEYLEVNEMKRTMRSK